MTSYLKCLLLENVSLQYIFKQKNLPKKNLNFILSIIIPFRYSYTLQKILDYQLTPFSQTSK